MSNVSIQFTPEEIRVLGMALGDLPFNIAAPLVFKIEKEVAKARQEQAKEEIAKTPE